VSLPSISQIDFFVRHWLSSPLGKAYPTLERLKEKATTTLQSSLKRTPTF